MATYDLTALGECLVDFQARDSGKMALTLEGYPGGAPANVLAGAARLGLKTAFLTKLGKDCFGDFLKNALDTAGVDMGGVVFSQQPTTLAIVSLDAEGDRSFQFYRDNTADVSLTADEVDYDRIANSRAFHFGSVSMTAEPARTATYRAAAFARGQGLLVSYDPNLRPLLWDSLEGAKTVIGEGLHYAHVVKLSEEELEFLTGSQTEQAALELARQEDIPLLMVTLGDKGSYCCHGGRVVHAPPFMVKCVDTTGAGDAFLAAALSFLLDSGTALGAYTEADLTALLRQANAAGAIAATGHGAIPSLPDRAALDAFLA